VVSGAPLLREGQNAWRLEKAERLAFLVDGEAYYSALLRALERARHSVLVAAWEIDDRTCLVRGDSAAGRPSRFGDVLRARLETCPDLQVHILAWDFAMIYAVERGLQPLFRLRFSSGPRLHLHLDGHHPVGACHHQKLVVIDDRVAFLGGLDITQHRWDRPAHRPDDPDRVDDEGDAYTPFHDVQVAVEGPAAAAVGELLRERWRVSTGSELKPSPGGDADPWPEDLAPDAEDVEVGLVRTRPAYDGQEEAREVERLYLDAIARARLSIYIENQYLTSAPIVRALAERLAEPEGPEVVLVLPRRCPGWLEQRTVGLLRRRRLQELAEADREERLRAVYPHVPGAEDGVFVHAKVMIVDDALARVGSANLSNRSMGFDSELDLALESGGDPSRAQTVTGLRDRLLAEHLGLDRETVARHIEKSNGSLIAALDELASSSSGRALRPLKEPPLPPDWDEALEVGQDLADPESPEEPERLLASFLARDLPGATRTPWVSTAAVVAVLAVLAAAWRFTPLGDGLSADRVVETITAVRQIPLAPLAVAAVYVVASVLFVPVTALIVATALVFPPLEGIVSALLGVLAASAATFGLGHLLGRGLVRRFAGDRVNEVSRRVARRGLLAVAAVRLVPIAPFSLVNIVAGASHVGFRDFLLGTLVGMGPGVVGIVLLEASLEELVRHPGWAEGLSAAAVLGALVAFVALVRRLAKPAG
jgi:phosphatidylserine/phosphatidylglycerophosphate/cardiolipin synthase-like enzyme/uncharacterized membrane protein YdjX (TVP38/TMEM64 family)